MGIAVTTTSLDERKSDQTRRRGMVSAVILGAIAVHVIGLIVAGAVIVARFFAEPKATFEVVREFRIPVKTREHKMNMARHEAMAPKPTFNDRLVSTRPTNFSLPEMPKIDLDQMLPLDPSEIVSDQISSLEGTAGLGSGIGSGGLGSGGTGATGMSFFGIQSEGSRIVLLFDVSSSVVNKAIASGIPLAEIKKETSNLLAKLPINARYSLVQFVRNYKPFSEELVAANPTNKKRTEEWIETEWSESGQMAASGRGVKTASPNGLPIVLDFAFSLQPDTVFLISDGSFEQTAPGSPNRSVPEDELTEQITRLQKAAGKPVPIHFIGFQMKDDDRNFWRRMCQRIGGKLRELGK